jgi:ketosteroid isomerase-like protein
MTKPGPIRISRILPTKLLTPRLSTTRLFTTRIATVVLTVAAFAALTPCLAQQAAAQTSRSDDDTLVLALDNSWNRALETKDIKALDLLLADSFVSIDIDGSIQTKREFLVSLKAPSYQAPAQAVTEQSKADVYGNSAVVVGIFRTQSAHKSKARRERFLDTWVNLGGTWRCVASVAVLIPSE